MLGKLRIITHVKFIMCLKPVYSPLEKNTPAPTKVLMIASQTSPMLQNNVTLHNQNSDKGVGIIVKLLQEKGEDSKVIPKIALLQVAGGVLLTYLQAVLQSGGI